MAAGSSDWCGFHGSDRSGVLRVVVAEPARRLHRSSSPCTRARLLRSAKACGWHGWSRPPRSWSDRACGSRHQPTRCWPVPVQLGLLDLVVLCDAALHHGNCSVAELEAAAAPGRRGSPVLRRALALADGRSESAWESVLRLLHVSCGVQVEPQYVLRDASGAFVARGDLWLVGTRTFHEYDGEVHRTPHQLRADLLRDRRILDVGWTRRGFTSPDVLFQASAILREADAALGRPSRPGRIRVWHRLLADSMLTPAGAERLRYRWSRARVNRPAA